MMAYYALFRLLAIPLKDCENRASGIFVSKTTVREIVGAAKHLWLLHAAACLASCEGAISIKNSEIFSLALNTSSQVSWIISSPVEIYNPKSGRDVCST